MATVLFFSSNTCLVFFVVFFRSFPLTSNSASRGWRNPDLRVWMNWWWHEKTPSSKTWTMFASLTTTGWERANPASRMDWEESATSSLRWSQTLVICSFPTGFTVPPVYCSIFEPRDLYFFIHWIFYRWSVVRRTCTQECSEALSMRLWVTS